MVINFEFNGKRVAQEDLEKENAKPAIVDKEDQQYLMSSLELLKKIKSAKGEKMSDFQEGLLDSAKQSLGEDGAREVEQSEDFTEANEGLDLLEQVKTSKRKKQEDSSGEAEKTKICMKCGREMPLSANFCGSCGNKFESPVEKKKVKVCSKCGRESEMSANFCGSCGNKLEKEEENEDRKEIDTISSKEKNDISEEEIASPENEDQTVEILNESSDPKEEDKTWSESDLETAAKDENSLLGFLDKIDGVQGSGKYYTREELKRGVKDSLDKLRMVDMKDKAAVNDILKYVTNQGEIKLREKVYQIALKEKLQGM